MSTPTLFRHPLSGHAHRAQLMLSLLGVEHELRDVDLRAGAQKRPEFLALNRFGQVPVLVDGDAVIADSNAILVYLATTRDREDRWYPADPARRAHVQRWLSVAAGELARGPARARLVTVFGASVDHEEAKRRAHALLELMERALTERPYLVGDAPTIADVALYTYTAHAPEGDVSLAPYPAVRSWLARIEALEGFVAMQPTVVNLAS